MKLILLAAGKSSRIFDKIKTNKCLIEVNKKPIIKHLIDNANDLGINDIDVVVGYKPLNIKKKLKFNRLNFIHNRKFNSTDMVYSSILALEKCNTDALICYTDIIFEKKIFKKLIKKKDNNIVVPHLKSWISVWKKRKKKIYDDAETFFSNKSDQIIEIGQKINSKNLKDINGQFMGIIYIPKIMIKVFISKYKVYKKNKVQFTEFLNFLILNKIVIKTFSYSGKWYEFDDIEDLITFKKN